MLPEIRPSSIARLILAAALALAAGWIGGRTLLYRDPPALPRLADGRTEGCLLCHHGISGLGPAHDPARMGCTPCHLGDAQARDQDGAHRGMVILSGDFATIYATCGRSPCHVTEAARVTTSLMARAPGVLSVDRFAFGERPTPDGRPQGFEDLDADRPSGSPAEGHARKLCGSCHLSLPKSARGDAGFFARGGGCAACHLGPPALADAAPAGRLHPDVSAVVSEQRCAGCHSRSGRIALSYHGVVELEPDDPRVTSRLPDGRPTGIAPADVHAKGGMTCLDCHVERELMGDGVEHRHAREAVQVGCADCHAPGPRPKPDPDAARVAAVLRRSWEARGLPRLSPTPLRTGAGTELWRTDASSRSLLLATTGEERPIAPASERRYHTLRGHERLSCQACHAQWAPRCTRCHTRLDRGADDVDHLSGKPTPGRWIEEAGGNGFGPPLLAVGPCGSIDPFVEGMSLRLEGVRARSIERTLWAPLDPHTTGASRTCASCHAPADLGAVYPRAGSATRSTARLLTPAEVDRVARVGRCLGCHSSYDDPVYADFARSLRRLAAKRRGGGDAAVQTCGGAPP